MPSHPLPNDKIRHSMPLRMLLGFVLAALATTVIAVFTYQSQQDRGEAVRRINSAVESIVQIQYVLSIIKDAETGQRGYLLAGEPRYLGPYETAEASLTTELERLRGLVGDSPRQLRRYEQLAPLARQKMSELHETIQLRLSGQADAALSVVRTDRGRATMDAIRSLVREMIAAEREELEERRAMWRTRRASRRTSPGAARCCCWCSSWAWPP